MPCDIDVLVYVVMLGSAHDNALLMLMVIYGGVQRCAEEMKKTSDKSLLEFEEEQVRRGEGGEGGQGRRGNEAGKAGETGETGEGRERKGGR